MRSLTFFVRCFFLTIFISNRAKCCYEWTRFRHLSNLERKTDEALTEYLRGFLAMCKRVTGHKLTDEEGKMIEIVFISIFL